MKRKKRGHLKKMALLMFLLLVACVGYFLVVNGVIHYSNVEALVKIRRNIRCGIGAEGDNSSAYPRFTLRSRIIYCKLGNIRKKLRLLLMI